jgi:8-amino-7-oxononanoate synthase
VLDSWFDKKLEERHALGLQRRLSTPSGMIDFTSNDYLGLSRSEELFLAIQQKASSLEHQNGATGSRLLSGNSAYTENIERKLAEIFKSERALIFNSGYVGNLSIFSSIPQRGDTILYDELAHASIRDGIRLSLAKAFSFRHNDLNDLESKIGRASGKIFIAVESIYSMDGDQCPLHEIVLLAEKYDASIILDEAHSTGAFGEYGSGIATALNLENRIAIRLYTFGKAMGIHGACVAGSKKLCDYLVNFARPFIYTTALSPHSILSIECAFDFLKENMRLQSSLQKNIHLFVSSTNDISSRTNSSSAIQTAIFPGNTQIRKVSAELQKKGFDVRPILSPTVPAGSERLRICLHTFNTEEEITSLASALREIFQLIN